MRALIYFPIIHSTSDLGSLGKTVNGLRADEQVQKQAAAIAQFWTMVATTLDSLELDYTNLKIYQDGLPVCGKEKEIAADVAATGSQNYRLLQDLQHKGAILMGTESPELLLQERTLMMQLLQSAEHSEVASETARTLLERRDDYIAKRIDETLEEEQMGLLFLGLMHGIETKLPPDIVFIQPFGKVTGIAGK